MMLGKFLDSFSLRGALYPFNASSVGAWGYYCSKKYFITQFAPRQKNDKCVKIRPNLTISAKNGKNIIFSPKNF